MKHASLLCAMLLAACSGAVSPDAATDALAIDGTNESSADAPPPIDSTASDAGAVDAAPVCVREGRACQSSPDSCCPGFRCESSVCVRRTDCRSTVDTCDIGGADSGCCPGLACMIRGGAGGTVCADPRCVATNEACDADHPCCPASACSGPPGMQRCLPTP